MPPHLFVMSFLRLGQMLLAGFLYLKAYRYKVTSSIDIFCQSSPTGQTTYEVEFPFAWIPVKAISDCTNSAETTTTHIWTGFGPTAYLFTALILGTFVYCVTAIVFYYNHHVVYDAKKTFPAVDLLASLIMGSFWVLDCYLAWINYPGLKSESSPDKVTTVLPVCNIGYCSAQSTGDFGDVNTFLFLGLACGLSWGISVWFIFMESGLCPEDEEELSEDYSDLDYADARPRAIRGLPRTIPPIYDADQDLPKESPYRTDYGFGCERPMIGYTKESDFLDGHHVQRNSGIEYTWNPGTLESQDFDRFARGLTFSPVPQVATVTNKQLERDVIGAKVHSKWNLFKA